MKRIVYFIVLLFFMFTIITGCVGPTSVPTSFSIDYIKTFIDIPDITEQEILAIETLQASGREFTLGMRDSTELFLLPTGELDGFAVYFADLLSELFEMNFRAEIFGWSELIAGLEAMKIDFTSETTPTDVRQGSPDELFEIDGQMVPGRGYIMSIPVAERGLRIFTPIDSFIRSETDLEGLRVGFLEGTTTAGDILQLYRQISFEAVEVIVPEDAGDDVNDYDIAVEMMLRGEIHAFIDEATADPAFYQYSDYIRSAIFFSMIHSPVSLTTVNPELEAIVTVLDKYITAGGRDRLYELYMESEFRYAQNKLFRHLTNDEIRFINNLVRRDQPILIAYEHDNYPISFYNDETGQFEGIANDVIKEISKLTGLRFDNAVDRDTIWEEIYKKLRAGEVSMVAQLLQSDVRLEQGIFLWTSVPYSVSYYALLSRSEFPKLAPYQVAGTQVGVVRQSGHEDIYNELFPNNNNLVYYDTFTESLIALETGEIDLLMGSEHLLLKQTNYHEKSGIKINIKLDVPLDSYFGFHVRENILRSIIDKAQYFVNTEAIEVDWTGRSFDYTKRMTEERALFMTYILVIAALTIVVMAFIIYKAIKLSRKLKEIASHDALTGIYNRRFFLEQAPAYVTRSLRLEQECYIIIYDLDHFKTVNDTYGHSAGDKVLKDIAQRIKNTIRTYDLFGRYGGEEFIILMCDSNKEAVLSITERIRETVIISPVKYENKEITITASFGVARVFSPVDIHFAINKADEALYIAKETGRNRVVFYESND